MDLDTNFRNVKVEISFPVLKRLVGYFKTYGNTAYVRDRPDLSELDILQLNSVNFLIDVVLDDNERIRKGINENIEKWDKLGSSRKSKK